MGRKGITQHDVAEAIESLQHAGLKTPSIRTIHQKLGRGSLTTISQHKRALEATQEDTDANSLPDPVTDGLSAIADQIWQQLAEAADARIEEAEQAANVRAEAAHAVRDQALQQRLEMETTLDALGGQLTESEARGQGLQTALKAAEEKTQADALHATQLQGNLETLTLELAHQRSECERLAREATNNEERLRAMQEQLVEQNNRLTREQAAHAHARETYVSEKDRWVHEQATFRKEHENLQTMLDAAKDQSSVSSQKLEALRHQVDTLKHEKVQLEKDSVNAESLRAVFTNMTTQSEAAVNELIAEKDARIADLLSVLATLKVPKAIEDEG